MPTYTFKTVTGEILQKRLSFKDYDQLLSGEKEIVDLDGNPLEIVFDPGDIGFVMKDGESGGWAGKALKENKFRAKHRDVMARREKDHVFKNKLIPNYAGQEAHSWSDVQDHVRSTKGEEAAKTYEPLVAKETQGDKA